MNDVLAIILAGGKGERLSPLTIHRAKPAVPFGGKYRIIDFTLSNCINSNIRKMAVITQYKSLSLDRHLALGWEHLFSAELGEFVINVPPQQRVDERWYAGTADAVYQNIYLIEKEAPPYLLILSGDHIYKMDYSDMYAFHKDTGATGTIAAIEVDRKHASAFGVIEVDSQWRIVGFEEKPADPKTIPGTPDQCLVSMGVYLFNTEMMIEELKIDAARSSSHDFGKNIIPEMMKTGRLFAYNFRDENKKEAKYWRDVGTIDSYWEANMDLVSVDPLLNLYDREWPIRTRQYQNPPAKFVFAQEYEGGRLGIALDSIVCDGCIISGGRVQNSVLSPNVRINSWATVEESILMENVEIGRHARIRRAIIDKDVYIPTGTVIGYDSEEDRKRFHVSPDGIVVIPKFVKSSLQE
ncbi:MAG: glucose-1-phosphate adenylyltransferase [Alphaproteobacteria bacterium]|uniref:Glucose-1-phosphate adenylyltransferase n=1 Tax=Candidatus Nitrobium versatile TaxID=2884831 RepID=A0A953JEY1_9BACT|nr:glucose-1-phosphate adenylyltransferase [Candidatus Nitrobium versatile]